MRWAHNLRNTSDSCEQWEEKSSEIDKQRNKEYLRNTSESCEQREERVPRETAEEQGIPSQGKRRGDTMDE